ncbi:MAG: NAD-dependent epimerase/dehydratase family protein [Archangium sp.]|nr:NAD-dependent epimerase/dehydratase family protein [Archangium sp.]
MSSLFAVIGGTGFAGAATVNAFVERGHRVRVISRHVKAGAQPKVEAVAADANDVAALTTALEGVHTAVLCARPDYWRWPTELVPMFQRAIDAASRTGTRLVLCDNLYAYGIPDGPLTESSPLRPHGPKGRARKDGAELLMRAHELGQVQVAIGRAADFYGPGIDYPNLKLLFGNAVEGKTVRLLGTGEAMHSVSFIKDVGHGLVTLAENDAAFGAVWHLPVAPPMPEKELVRRIVELAGTHATIASTPAWAVHALFKVMGLFSPMMRELPEVQYQHELPFVVDDSRFVKAFGQRATPMDEAVLETLAFWRDRLGLTPASVASVA